jgi:hypothetical protein
MRGIREKVMWNPIRNIPARIANIQPAASN